MPSADRLPVVDLRDTTWRSRFIRASEAVTPVERHHLARMVATRELTRVQRGVYAMPSPSPHPEERLLDRIRAYHLEHPDAVFSHRSAAALWRLPRLGPWPSDVEVLGPVVPGGHRRAGVIHRRESVPAAIVEIEGIPTTSLARTAVDLARLDETASAVATMDAALRGIRATDGREFLADREAMRALLDLFPGTRGIARAAWVIEFGDGRAERPGESLSRVQMHRLGVSMPQLQVPFHDVEGLMEPDFYWEEFEAAGEFDGLGKYLLRGPDPTASAVSAVLGEKRREDRMRRLPGVRTVARWDWRIANDRPAFGLLLRDHGIR